MALTLADPLSSTYLLPRHLSSLTVVAHATNSPVEWMPSFLQMLFLCWLTVIALMDNAEPTCLLVWPSPMRRRTSFSRLERAEMPAPSQRIEQRLDCTSFGVRSVTGSCLWALSDKDRSSRGEGISPEAGRPHVTESLNYLQRYRAIQVHQSEVNVLVRGE